jgi:iron complex outermembrane receptor protein
MRAQWFGRREWLNRAMLAAVMAAVPAGAAAQSVAVLSGRVVHAATQAAVSGAAVVLEEAGRTTLSSADGTFAIENVPVGTYHVLVAANGFVPYRAEIAVTAGGASMQVALTPELHYSEVVSVSPQPRDPFEAYQATTVLAGQDLALKLEGTLGASLASQPGLAQRSFGPGPSRPVIRGLDGDRVLILEDGQRTGDLSSQSGDHGVNVNPAAAARLEVVRGPATLLYGANAIGGLVNVITESVPVRPATGVSGSAQFDVGTAAAEGGAAAEILVGNGRVAFRAGGSGRRSGDVATPEGDIANTQSRSGFGDLGLSWTSQRGYLGASYAYDDTRYGVPYIEEGQVELTPRRHAVNLRGEIRDLSGFVSGVRGSLGYRRYRHEEAVGDHIGTRFANDSVEFDVLATHRDVGRLKGTFGGWGLTRAFSSSGEEALAPPVDQKGLALFLYEELGWTHVTLQFGGRYDRTSFAPEGGLPDRAFDNVSASLGLLVRPSDQTTVAVSLARAVRNPALEELYYFGPHAGNFAFEIGNPDLGSERGLGLDVSFRWRLPRFSGEVTYFRNAIDDFIFRQPVTGEAFDERFGGGEHGEHGHAEFPIVEYVAADSVLQGFEAHADLDLTAALVAEVAFDAVRGERQATGDPLPRMPPRRLTAGLRYKRNALQVGTEVVKVSRQDRVFPPETPTDGYALLKLFGAYSFVTGRTVNMVTVRLDNATNELYRNHLSLIKDFVPEMGRNVRVVYSLRF